MYDNESRAYLCDPNIIERGDWMQDEIGLLYIIPPTESDAEMIGPDDLVAVALRSDMQSDGRVRDVTIAHFNLERVPTVLRRCDAANGYYVA